MKIMPHRLPKDPPTTQSSKADEIAYLKKLVDQSQRSGDTYLKSLLTPQLLEWFETQIRSDLPPDAIGQLLYDRSEDAQKVVELSRQLIDQTDLSHEAENEMKYQIMRLEVDIKRRAYKIAELIEYNERTFRMYIQQNNDNWSLKKDAEEARTARVVAEAEADRLKIKMFDQTEIIENLRNELDSLVAPSGSVQTKSKDFTDVLAKEDTDEPPF
jgi:hypothetical protein